MATDSAAPTLRHLWQVPTFLVGATAFVAVWRGVVPAATVDHAAPFRKDVTALRAATDKLTPDAAELDSQIRKVARAAEAFPELAPQAHFALGSAYVRLAEITPAPDAARPHWSLAAQHFERVKADQMGTDPMEVARLVFRSAKARAVGVSPTAPAGELTQLVAQVSAVPPGDDPGEAHRLAGELLLRFVPPNFPAARDALARYVAEAGLATPPQSVARAKLRLSEVHLMLNEPDAARKWLAQLGPETPPDVFAPGKAQFARLLMADGQWAQAAKEWEAVRAVAALPPGLKPMAAYYLGACRLALRDPDAAAKLFEESAKSDGPEGVASAVRLAEIGLRAKEPARHKAAATQLVAAVGGAKPGTFANPLLPPNEVRAAFEATIQVLTADAAFDDAEKVAVAYRAVAAPGRDREKRAELMAEWGTALQKAGGNPKPKFAAAADEYAALAAGQTTSTAKADMLRRAAGFHKQAGNTVATVEALEKVVALPNLPDDAAGPAWLELGDAMLASGRTDKAVVEAFNRAMATKSDAATATRYRLARAALDSKNPNLVKLGAQLLKQVADASNIGPADQFAHERALVELAHDHIQAKEFVEAEARLRKQLNFYPTGPESGLGRLLLGVCLLARAAPPSPTAPDPADAKPLREEAVRLFQKVIADSDASAKAGGPAERADWLRLQASIRILQAYEQMRRPQDVLTAAAELRPRTKGTVEELIVLSMMYHANKQMRKDENAFRVRDEMKAVFDALPPSAFNRPTGDYSRAFWEQKWFAAEPPK